MNNQATAQTAQNITIDRRELFGRVVFHVWENRAGNFRLAGAFDTQAAAESFVATQAAAKIQTVFNTGRQYTEAGQRIAARIVGNVVLFVDVDRGIKGLFPEAVAANIIYAAEVNARLFKNAVLDAYDRTEYVWEGFDHDDAMNELKAAALAI
jgi:hypothetical protein